MAGSWKPAGRYSGAGIELVAAVLIVGGVGYGLDLRFWGGHGWGLIVGVVLGLAAGVRNLMRSAQAVERDLEREDAQSGGQRRWNVDESWLHKPDEPESGSDSREPKEPNQGRGPRGGG
jgi:hypothetical protein